MPGKNQRPIQPNPPAPERAPGKGAPYFMALSGFVAVLILGYGATLLNADTLTGLQIGFGCATLAYGLLALGGLFCAYRSGTRACVVVSQAGAVFYLLVYLLGLVSGVNTYLGYGGILLVALAVWCNWFAISKIIMRPRTLP